MGIKSTTTLTRGQATLLAINTIAQLDLAIHGSNNEALGNLLDDLTDALHRANGTTNFDNYIVTDEPEPTRCTTCGHER